MTYRIRILGQLFECDTVDEAVGVAALASEHDTRAQSTLRVRLTDEHAALFKCAAKKMGMDVSKWIRHVAVVAAREQLAGELPKRER